MNASLMRWAGLSLVTFELIMLASTWGHWLTMIALLTLLIIRVGGSGLFVAWMVSRRRRGMGPRILVALNMLITLVEAQILQWNLIGLMHMIFQVVFVNGHEEREDLFQHRVSNALFLVAVICLALHAGVEPWRVGLFCASALLLYGQGEAKQWLLTKALRNSRESHQRLLRMQEQLVAQEKLSSLGLLAAGVAHEINNPMAFVTSNVQGLLRDLKAQRQLPPELREYVDDVLPATLDGIRRVNTIVADLRRFARNDLEQPIEFELNSEVKAAIRISQCERKENCRVEMALGEVPLLVGRPRQIGQVLVNLIVNAVQALPREGGMVRVSTRTVQDEVLVEVSDTGAGMSREVLSHLFQPFFTTKPVGEGTGLGLAVAYGIVTGHGGHIDVESEPGKGTRVVVHLPATAEKMQAALAAVPISLSAAQTSH